MEPASATVARDEELDRLFAHFRTGGPALLLVRGEDGMGKSGMLAALEQRAREAGWATVHRSGDHTLRIGPRTTEHELLYEVDRLMLAPLERTSVAPRETSASAAEEPLHPLIRRLTQDAPIAVLIDGYRPSEAVARRWIEALLPSLRRADSTVVIVVADTPGHLEPLEPHSDATVDLGPLDVEQLSEFLRRFGEALAPPMTEREVAEYATQVSPQPDLLSPLLRVLELARRPTQPDGPK
jgi:AAA ATPase domain